jgi:RNA recognition motif-containing protein
MSKRLYIGNLSSTTTKDTIVRLFESVGQQVPKLDLVMSRDAGHSRGFAFAEMASEDEGAAAIKALHGRVVDGRTLKVDVAAEPKSRFGGHVGARRPSVK